jgi:hypothetical protein
LHVHAYAVYDHVYDHAYAHDCNLHRECAHCDRDLILWLDVRVIHHVCGHAGDHVYDHDYTQRYVHVHFRAKYAYSQLLACAYGTLFLLHGHEHVHGRKPILLC